ncbi:MAG: hypothetical protein QM765_29400 [Myxococcales bacterium]
MQGLVEPGLALTSTLDIAPIALLRRLSTLRQERTTSLLPRELSSHESRR